MKHPVLHSLADLADNSGRKVGNEFGVLLRGKEPHEPEFANDNVRIHFLMINKHLTEYNIVGDAKTPSMRCFPFNSKLKAGDILTTGQYMNYQTISNLKSRQLLEKSFHSNHINLRDGRRKKPLVTVGINRLVLTFGKASNNHF